MSILRRLSLILLLLLLHPTPLPAEAVAISSVVFNGYTRERQSDGKYKPEYYIFGEGGRLSRPIADPAMDQMTFPKIARLIAAPLAVQNYHPAPQAADAGLLILVFWGSTAGSRDNRNVNGTIDRLSSASSAYTAAQAADKADNAKEKSPTTTATENDYYSMLWQMQLDNDVRDKIDTENAQILGYGESLSRARFARHMSFAQDTLDEVSSNRYYVVLQAYDYQTAQQHRKLKPLWTSRISVSEQGDFAKAVEQMVWSASRYFGQETDGLKRLRVKEGTVELGPLKVLEVDPATK